MEYTEHVRGGVPIKVWDGHGRVPMDEKAIVQVAKASTLPIVHHHVSLMADGHVGIGATVGSVIPTLNAIIPGSVGVDIGCGMAAVRTSLSDSDLPDDADVRLFDSVSSAVPHGGGKEGVGSWREVPMRVQKAWSEMAPGLDKILRRHARSSTPNAETQLGTLGGGNHFVEVCIDQEHRVWFMLHSGSRGIGNRIGTSFIELAKKDMERLNRQLPDKDLAYLEEGTEHFDEYVAAVTWAQEYARINRELMMAAVVDAARSSGLPEFVLTGSAVNCHHNYVARERHFGEDVWVTRKGAVRAQKGDMCIIPGCLASGTRILMSNGFYKNIEDIRPGDRVINGRGIPTTVVNWFDRGLKETLTYRSNQFWSDTFVTPDHQHMIGDLSNINWQAGGRKKVLDRFPKNGESRIKWSSLSNAPEEFMFLLPKSIQFEGSTDPIIIWERSVDCNYELGYMIGSFLGDGTSRYEPSDGGQVSWSLGLGEAAIAEKVSSCIYSCTGLRPKIYHNSRNLLVTVHDVDLARFFEMFGKRHQKHLPEFFWRTSIPYLSGIMDGMIDTDGHYIRGKAKFTNTSTQCIELFGVIHQIVRGHFPSVSVRPPSAGGLKRCSQDKCRASYRGSSLAYPMIISDHQLVYPIGLTETRRGPFRGNFARNLDLSVRHTYDIELSGNEPSFIANNVIVHNSMGAKSFIARGRGDPESFNSCSHGAGRVMARGEAKRSITVEQHMAATKGVACRKDAGVVDESPAAYKPIDDVMAAQEGLVEIVWTLKQIVCVKG